jgi:hypothetical protein
MVAKTGFISLCIAGLFVLVGCSSQPVVIKEPAVTPTVTTVPTTPEPTTGGIPQGDLKKLKADYDTAKAAYAKDPKTKDVYVTATVKYGTATMLADSLTPKEKYPGALKLYREALKLDPKNEEATKNKTMIEDIYKQMGRPIPE